MTDKVTRQCPQTTTFEVKGEPKQIRTEVPLLTSLLPRPDRLSTLFSLSVSFKFFCITEGDEYFLPVVKTNKTKNKTKINNKTQTNKQQQQRQQQIIHRSNKRRTFLVKTNIKKSHCIYIYLRLLVFETMSQCVYSKSPVKSKQTGSQLRTQQGVNTYNLITWKCTNIFLCMVYAKVLFALTVNSTGCCHLRSLFADKEQKKVGSWRICYLSHSCRPCVSYVTDNYRLLAT